MDQLDMMMDWESGELSQADEVTLFQSLVNSGLAWQLQGCYGRHAAAMLAAGTIHRSKAA